MEINIFGFISRKVDINFIFFYCSRHEHTVIVDIKNKRTCRRALFVRKKWEFLGPENALKSDYDERNGPHKWRYLHYNH